MPVVDPDFCEFKVSIRDYFSGLPFVDAITGRTSLDMPVETVELDLSMYEPRKKDLCHAVVTFPSLLAFPELRTLLQQILLVSGRDRRGMRVEVYDFQPDCGDPIFAGFVDGDGVTEQDGRVILQVGDPMIQGAWQHVRRIEEFSAPVSTMYQRAMSHWVDVISDDFTETAPPWTPMSGYTSLWLANSSVPVAVGDTFLLEADVVAIVDPVGKQLVFRLGLSAASNTLLNQAEFQLSTGYIGSPAFTWYFQNQTIALSFTQDLWTASTYTSAPVSFPGGTHVTMLIQFTSSTTVTISVYRDNQFVTTQSTRVPIAIASSYTPYFQYWGAQWPSSSGGITTLTNNGAVQNFRVRKLRPYVSQAARFNAQTQDSIYYQANNEDIVSFLNFFAEKDNAEWRVKYHAWPILDELELDAVGTLGVDASALLGYSDGGAGYRAAAFTTPGTAGAIDGGGAMLGMQPFRFEEGFNLAAVPKRNPRATPYATEVIRQGSGNQDAQMFAVAYSPRDTGGPNYGPAVNPNIELLTNDDRIGLISVARSMVAYDMARSTDITPSLDLEVMCSREFAWKWREGDHVNVITRSLLTNVEQSMRVVKIKASSGKPSMTVTVGKLDAPDTIRQLSLDMTQGWLYEQSGSGSGTTYVYPYVPVTLVASATSTVMTIPLDAITTGTQIIGAKLHWFTGETSVSDVSATISGQGVSTLAVGKDSGPIDVSALFPFPDVYTLSFTNVGLITHTLQSAYLVLRIRA